MELEEKKLRKSLETLREAIDKFDEAYALNTYQNPELRQKMSENILIYNRQIESTKEKKARNFEIKVKKK